VGKNKVRPLTEYVQITVVELLKKEQPEKEMNKTGREYINKK